LTNVNLTESIAVFANYIQNEKRYSLHTHLAYESDLNQFLQFLINKEYLQEVDTITSKVIRAWIVNLYETKISARSINRKIATLKTFFRFLRRNGTIFKNPAKSVLLPKFGKKLPQFFDIQKLNDFLNSRNESIEFVYVRDTVTLEVLYGCGVRVSELISLKDSDIDIENKTLKVLGKRNKQRIIPIQELTLKRISDYILEKQNKFDSEYFLLNNKGEKASASLVGKICRNLLTSITTSARKNPHALRHTYATGLINNGADINSVKELLGHTSLAATQVYIHNTFEKLKKSYLQAHPRSKNTKQ